MMGGRSGVVVEAAANGRGPGRALGAGCEAAAREVPRWSRVGALGPKRFPWREGGRCRFWCQRRPFPQVTPAAGAGRGPASPPPDLTAP